MIRSTLGLAGGAILLTAAVGGCARSSEVSASPPIEEKTFTLQPSTAPLSVAFLSGQVEDLTVVERVEQGTGRVVEPPKLRGTLKLKNASTDRAARLIGGRIAYVGRDGTPIPLDEGRGEATIEFYNYGDDRLDPGEETSHTIEVPFPAAALDTKTLASLQVEVTFIPTSYEEETASVEVTLAQ